MAKVRTWFVLGSFGAHGVFAVAIGEIEIRELHAATAIEIAETVKKQEPPPPAEVDAEPPKPQAERRAARARAPEPAQAPPPPTNEPAPAPQAMDALPDFGLSLSGGSEGTGLSLPSGGGTAPSPRGNVARAVPRTLTAKPPEPVANACAEPATKPKPRSVPQPAYTDQARAAQIQGKVRVQLTVDETGRVVDVKLLQGLGYGLDEAALAAARSAQFEPAVQCGKPTRATFTISMRFSI